MREERNLPSEVGKISHKIFNKLWTKVKGKFYSMK